MPPAPGAARCRPTQEEREALARNVHQFRTKFQVATLLSRPPSHWATFQAAFHYVLLGMSPQGSPVLLLKVGRCSCAWPQNATWVLCHHLPVHFPMPTIGMHAVCAIS